MPVKAYLAVLLSAKSAKCDPEAAEPRRLGVSWTMACRWQRHVAVDAVAVLTLAASSLSSVEA